MGVKKILIRTAGKAANIVSKGAALSPEELEKIQSQREAYFSQMPDPTDGTAQILTERLIAACGTEIYNAYLNELNVLYSPVEKSAEFARKNRDGEWVSKDFNLDYNTRYINITKWVIDKKENSLEKLVNVYEVLSDENCNIALIFHRTCELTNIYLAVTNNNNASNRVDADNFIRRIEDALKGNFPGSEWRKEIGIGTIPCLKKDDTFSVAAASNIPAEKSEKFVSQTIEKLLDGVIPEARDQEYILILLATPVRDIAERKLKLSEFHSGLTPYAQWQTDFRYSESDTIGSSATVGVNIGASAGLQSGQNQSLTQTAGETSSESESEGETESLTESESDAHTDSYGSSDTKSEGSAASVNVGTDYVGGSAEKSFGKDHSESRGTADTVTKSVAKSIGKTVTKTLGKAITKSAAATTGVFRSANFGGNFGMNFARASNVSATIGKNEGITQTYENYNIKHILEYLEKQMKRLDQCSALGMWDFAAYILSEDINVASNVAHSYLAITQGEESYMSQKAINIWRGDRGADSADAQEICRYLKELRHPIFALNPAIVSLDNDINVYPAIVTATTSLTGKELAYSLNFPRKSISGLPVIECAEFGRNVSTYEETEKTKNDIMIGNVFHMYHEENLPVCLKKQSLASHTFVTGSTGSGKSNTIYQMLNQLKEQGVYFLVIEPAKGEYKHAFGNEDDVHVFGTNPAVAQLFRINPFSFPREIHVLEHVDRLVEIFNVCWPMYAAMPAVLKKAVECSYEACGWNLETSENLYGESLYPSFKDVCHNVKSIIDSSEYDDENKGAYKGALLTRLQSLSTGLNRLIFSNDEIGTDELFDTNVIVDLSRIGSSETKSLLMGMIILKLQEYRMGTSNGTNAALKHVTVLEEAHNLLKRTSTEQSSENANLLGKSVEMISNAIAEMRTYGEGFIIADQAPGLLDMAVIRNTNTKVIMRLPDLGDRLLVGKAAGLNEDQIEELAKLPRGVAAVYQNEWIQPVLCKIKKANISEGMYLYRKQPRLESRDRDANRAYFATLLSKGNILNKEMILSDIRPRLFDMKIEDSVKVSILKWIENPPKEPKMTKLAPIMSELFPEVKNAIDDAYRDEIDPREWTKAAEDSLRGSVGDNIENQVRRDIIQSIFTDYLMFDMNNIRALEEWSKTGGLI